MFGRTERHSSGELARCVTANERRAKPIQWSTVIVTMRISVTTTVVRISLGGMSYMTCYGTDHTPVPQLVVCHPLTLGRRGPILPSPILTYIGTPHAHMHFTLPRPMAFCSS